MNTIQPEKLAALLLEGFSEEYLRDIMKVKPDPENPNVDLNSHARQLLGLDCESSRAPVSMTNWDISVIPPRRSLHYR